MARNRQRAKQRQAERRAARLAERGAPDGGARRATPPAPPGESDPAAAPDDLRSTETLSEPELDAGAPPEDAGRSDTVVAAPPPELDPARELELDEEEPAAAEEDGGRTRLGRDAEDGRGADSGAEVAGTGAEAAHRGKVMAFLAAVVAELRRVQWPDRSALTTLTGIVLGFVLIAGGYLGLLDVIFKALIEALLY